LLNSAIQKIELPNNFIGQKRYLKAVSIGETLNSAEILEFDYQGNYLKPFSVVNIKRDGQKLSWNRRSRYNSFLLDGVDIPIGEESENYLIEIPELNLSLTTTKPEIEIDAIFDKVNIYQMSILGRGI
jgi:hypothetical protein